jgi:hypothetical protein
MLSSPVFRLKLWNRRLIKFAKAGLTIARTPRSIGNHNTPSDSHLCLIRIIRESQYLPVEPSVNRAPKRAIALEFEPKRPRRDSSLWSPGLLRLGAHHHEITNNCTWNLRWLFMRHHRQYSRDYHPNECLYERLFHHDESRKANGAFPGIFPIQPFE